ERPLGRALFHDRAGVLRVEPEGALAQVPAEVAGSGHVVDLFPEVLPDVGYEQSARLAVDAEAVGVAQTPEVDLWTRLFTRPLVAFGKLDAARERVVVGDAVRLLAVHVEAQDAAQQSGHVLPVAQRRVTLRDVVGRAAVTEAEVQVA